MDSPPLLTSLLDAFDFVGPHARVRDVCLRDPEFSWIFRRAGVEGSCKSDKVQANVLKALRPAMDNFSLGTLLAKKLVVTLGSTFAERIRLPALWFDSLRVVLDECKVFARVCWVRTVAGGWTTSVRMHEDVQLECLFGCPDSQDCMIHYLTCPILWNLASEFYPNEESISIEQRLSLLTPSKDKIQRLALCHAIYHACKNDTCCYLHGSLARPRIVQTRGAEHARTFRHFLA